MPKLADRMMFDPNTALTVATNVHVSDTAISSLATISVCPELAGKNSTALILRTSTSVLYIQLDPDQRKALLEELLAQQEGFD